MPDADLCPASRLTYIVGADGVVIKENEYEREIDR